MNTRQFKKLQILLAIIIMIPVSSAIVTTAYASEQGKISDINETEVLIEEEKDDKDEIAQSTKDTSGDKLETKNSGKNKKQHIIFIYLFHWQEEVYFTVLEEDYIKIYTKNKKNHTKKNPNPEDGIVDKVYDAKADDYIYDVRDKDYDKIINSGVFNAEGFDKDGFDAEGFNKEGYDKFGFNRYGLNKTDYLKKKAKIEHFDKEQVEN